MNPVRHCLFAALVCMPLCTVAFAQALEVNTANEAELDSMRGLGPQSTARILKAREAGVFADWQDLMQRVKGIKQGTAQRLSAQGFTVNGQRFMDAADQPSNEPANVPGSQPASAPAE